MYFVKYDTSYIHDPRASEYILLDVSLDCEENSCGYCDFTIYPNHPLYGKLKERDADHQIEVYDDDTLLFAGFINELGKEFYLDGHVKCKGELDYLRESIVRPYSTIEKGYGTQAPYTVDGYFEWLIKQHNDQVNPNKRFVVGINEGAIIDPNNYIFRESTTYPTTIDEISDKLLKELGGYIRVRHENGIRYIDYIAQWTKINSQILDFGVNLTDYSQDDDTTDLATYVVPLGARMADTSYEYDDGYYKTEDTVVDVTKDYYTESWGFVRCEGLTSFDSETTYYEHSNNEYVETSDTTPNGNKRYYTYNFTGYSKSSELDSFWQYEQADITAFESGTTYYEYDYENNTYTQTSDTTYDSSKTYYVYVDTKDRYYEYYPDYDESDLLLTVDGLTDGEYDVVGYKKMGDKVYCESAANKYGWIGMVYENSDITTKEELRVKGTAALRSRVSPIRTIEIRAVDMHFLNKKYTPIRVGEYVRVRSEPHELDSYFVCKSIDLDLNNPENSVYTLGSTYDVQTGEHNAMIDALNNSEKKPYEEAIEIPTALKANAVEKGT